MEQYIKVKEVLKFTDFDCDTNRATHLDLAVSAIQEKVSNGHTASCESYWNEFRVELDAVLKDPEFDWVEAGKEAGNVEFFPDSENWPYNSGEGILLEFKAILFDFLYPNQKIPKEDLDLIIRVTLFLLLEVEDKTKWVSYKTLLTQLRTMKPQWRFLEYHHLERFHSYSMFERQLTDPFMGNNSVGLAKNYPHYVKDMEFAKKSSMSFIYLYEGWPPFQTEPSAPYYLQYDKQSWLKILNESATDARIDENSNCH